MEGSIKEVMNFYSSLKTKNQHYDRVKPLYDKLVLLTKQNYFSTIEQTAHKLNEQTKAHIEEINDFSTQLDNMSDDKIKQST